jgi:uncharacterized metal-binding protein
MNDDNQTPADYADKPLLYSCSGCSSAAQLANHLALRMDREGTAEMSCIVGLGGDVRSLVRTARKAEESGRPIIMIDGCPLQCGRHTLARHGIEPDLHWDLSKKDVRKAKHVDFEPADAQRLQPELTRAIKTLHVDESPSPLAGDGGGAFSGFDIGQGAEGQSFTGLGRHDGKPKWSLQNP